MYRCIRRLFSSGSQKPPSLKDLLNSNVQVKQGIANHNGHNHCNISYEKSYARLINGNREYVKNKTSEDDNFFKSRAESQKPKYLLIGCADSRVPPNELTGTEPGEIFIHRNVANLVISSDLNCMSTIQYAVQYLKVEHIIVMGHTKCGGVMACTQSNNLGMIDQWIQHIRDIAVAHKSELENIKDEKEFVNKLIEINVREQALNVCKNQFVQKAWAEGRDLRVHGWLCDIETGLINDLDIANNDWNKIKSFYKYNF